MKKEQARDEDIDMENLAIALESDAVNKSEIQAPQMLKKL